MSSRLGSTFRTTANSGNLLNTAWFNFSNYLQIGGLNAPARFHTDQGLILLLDASHTLGLHNVIKTG